MTTFTINNATFTQNENGYCYKTENGKKSRISKAIFDEAYEQYIEEKKNAVEEQEIKAEAKKQTKKAKRSKKNAVYTFKNGEQEITLTQKQMDFLTYLPNDDFFEHGADSTLWIDYYCDTIANVMNAMVVGAMVSTLREKNIIVVGQDRVNGKKCKFFAFTEIGKAILKEMGLV